MSKDTKQKIINEFLAKPSIYTIDVIDNSMLPENIKKRQTLDFVVKPPTINTLTQMAEVLMEIPEEILTSQDIKETEALKYLTQMVRLFCIISWGKLEPYPEWYEPFLKANLTSNEMFMLFKEMAIKSQTSFFLTSLKMMDAANPMTMREFQTGKDSTPTSS